MEYLQYSEQEAYLLSLAGRLLLENSVRTEGVHQAVDRLAKALGIEVRVFVEYKALMLTIKTGYHFSARVSTPVPLMKIDMALTNQVLHLIEEVEKTGKEQQDAIAQLEKIRQTPPLYHRWLVVLMLGLAAGGLAKIFAGDWLSFAIAGFATAIGVILRQELSKRQFNFFLIIFAAAFVGGILSGVAIRLGLTSTPEVCLLVPSMMLVPGVHLINAVLDMVENHMSVGIARLGFSLMTLGAILFGLLLSANLTGTLIAVSSNITALSLGEDIIFAGLVAAGFAVAFNVPKKILWACILCGMIGHGVRLLCIQFGPGIIWGNLIASTVVGLMAMYFSRWYKSSIAAISFGAVVGMIPGIFAFRAGSGLIQIMTLGSNAELPLIANTIVMTGTAVLMTLGIPLGIGIPSIIFGRRR